MEFGRVLPTLRRRIEVDLRRPGLPKPKVLATVVWLLENTFIRVGNDEYARDNHSFGLTTLKDRHVALSASEVRFHFRGKSGVFHETTVRAPAIARIVRRCRDLPGQELFQYLGEDGQPATIDSADVNDYIREATGEHFTAKDFRTGFATSARENTNRADEPAVGESHRTGRGKASEHTCGVQKELHPSRRDRLISRWNASVDVRGPRHFSQVSPPAWSSKRRSGDSDASRTINRPVAGGEQVSVIHLDPAVRDHLKTVHRQII
jgi:hypothetical protein